MLMLWFMCVCVSCALLFLFDTPFWVMCVPKPKVGTDNGGATQTGKRWGPYSGVSAPARRFLLAALGRA